jgi:hypothetical protein
VLAALASALPGCDSRQPLTQGPDGYDATRFGRTVDVQRMLNTFTFTAGSVFIADRRVGSDPVYCGQVSQPGGTVLTICMFVSCPDTLGLGPTNSPQCPLLR